MTASNGNGGTPTIELCNLYRHFGRLRAVDGVSFKAYPGQVMGFIGPNGAGKTTAMRILATLDVPTAGEAFINGYSVVDDPDKVRRIVGFMPDSFGKYANLDVVEYVDFFARAYGLSGGIRRDAVERVLVFTELRKLANKPIIALVTRLERLGDRFNPIVVKEVRQALKSRQFVGTFLLLLLAAWAGSIFGVSYLGESIDYGSSAVTFYAGFLFALCAASLVIVPFSTFRGIIEERTETTLELLQITALSPVQIVRGKTLSAMVQVLVYYCAIAPFLAFTALLPGFDVVHVAFSLVMLLITSLCFSMVALAIGAHARNTTSQAFSSLFVIARAVGGMMAFFGFMTAAGEGIRFDESDTWWALALVVFLGLSTGYVYEQGAVAQLTFDSDNRSTGIRLAAGAQWLLCWIGLLTFLIVRQPPPLFPDDGWRGVLEAAGLRVTFQNVPIPDNVLLEDFHRVVGEKS